MTFVINASIVVDWALNEGHAAADMARERLRTDTAFAPALWWYETRNALIANERRGRLDAVAAAQFLARLARFPITLVPPPDEVGVMVLARRHRLTVYDAAYLDLAAREGLPLATLDAALAAAARAEGVPVLSAGA